MKRFKLEITQSNMQYGIGDENIDTYEINDIGILNKIKDIYLEKFNKGVIKEKRIELDIYDNQNEACIYTLRIDKKYLDLLAEEEGKDDE